MAIAWAALLGTYDADPSTSFDVACSGGTSGRHLTLAVICPGDRVVTSVTDSAGNTWTVHQTQANATTVAVSVASCYAATTPTTVTVNLSADATWAVAWVDEWTGGDTTGWFDIDTSTTATDAAPTSGATGTSSADAGLVIGMFGQSGSRTLTEGSGYTKLRQGVTSAFARTGMLEYKVVSGAAAYTADCSSNASAAWAAICCVFQAAAGGPQTITPSGTITPAGAATRDTAKTLAGAASPAGAVARLAAKTLAGTIGPAGAIARAAAKLLTGQVTPAGTVTLDGGQAGATDTLEQQLLDHVLGLTPYAPPPLLYLALYTTAPGDDGAGGVEPSGNGYSRIAVPNDPDHWPAAAGGVKTHAHPITWPTPSAGWGTIRAVGVLDHPTAGTLLFHGAVDPVAVTTGQVVQLKAGALTLTLD